MSEPLLQINNLHVGFKSGTEIKPAISGVSLSINAGETFALLGESGCGKSLTSLSIMQLLPTAAQIYHQANNPSEIILEKQNLLQLSEVQMRKIRGARIAMIFQEPMTSLNPVLTVGEQIYEVLRVHTKLRGLKARKRIIGLFDAVGLPQPDLQLKRYPHQLSGGMKQRIMIAMALAGEPDLLIADEPTSALDVTIQKQILDLLKQLQQKTNMAMLFITHDLAVVKDTADKVAVMYAGHLIEQADSKTFFEKPLHPYSQQLFASLPNINKRDKALAVIPGIVPALTQDFKGCRFASRCIYQWDACTKIDPRWLQQDNKQYVRCHLYDDTIQKAANQKDKTDNQIKELKSKSETTNSERVIALDNLKVYFPIHKGLLKRTVGYVKAVDGVSLHLNKGKTLAIVGESGCGKTTLAKTVLQLLPKTAGNIRINGDTQHKNKNLRRYAQIIFQDPFSSMNPRMMVSDIISEGMRALRIGSKAEQQQRLDKLIQQVGLPADSATRYPHEFSGGQRQRICIARALAIEPELIICDEPTSALDVSVQAQILNLLKQLQIEKQLSYLFITHNMAVVAYMADEIAVMYQGKIVEQGDVKQILHSPQHEYTKQLLAAVPSL